MILGGILRQSDPAHALEIYDQTLRRLAEIKNNARLRRDEVKALVGSSYALRALGRAAEARKQLDKAFQRLSELQLYPKEQIQAGSEPEAALRALADWEAGAGNILRAIEIYRELLEAVMAGKPKPETVLADAFIYRNIWVAKASLHRRFGQTKLGSALETQRHELWRGWDRVLPHNDFVQRQLKESGLQ